MSCGVTKQWEQSKRTLYLAQDPGPGYNAMWVIQTNQNIMPRERIEPTVLPFQGKHPNH